MTIGSEQCEDTFLATGGYMGGKSVLTLNLPTIGNTYLVQLVLADSRAALNGRYATFSAATIAGTSLLVISLAGFYLRHRART